MPKVSVTIPTYQYADFLGEAIDSVLAQTYKDFELIVVDDGSTDRTRELVARYGYQTKYIYQDNRGLAAARNTGILASKGEYIAFLDADDVWMPNKLELEVEFLDTHPSAGLVYSNYTYFGSRAGSRKSGFDELSPVAGHPIKELFLINPIISSAILIRKSCFDKVGLFDESLQQCEDLDMWLHIAKYFEIDNIDTPLARYRLHDRNMHLEDRENSEGFIAVRRKCLESNKSILTKSDLREMREYHCRTCRSVGFWYLSNGIHPRARELFWEYLKLHPLDPVAYTSLLRTFLPPRVVSWIDRCRRNVIPSPVGEKQSKR